MHPNEFVPLSREQHAIVDLCREFGAAEIRPAVIAAADHAIQTPWELWRKAAKAGITAFMMPSEYGGGGSTDVFTQCLALEELAAADAAVALLLTSGGCFADPVLEMGTDAQKERWLRPLTSDDPPMTALAVAEPDLGSASAAITTKARRVGSGYKLSGSMTSISNGGVADFYLLFATIDSTRRAQGVTAFLIEKGASGLTFGEPTHQCGHRASVTTEVVLDEVFVPDNQRLGAEGQGFDGLTRTFDTARTALAAAATGLARACRDLVATEASAGQAGDIEVSAVLADMSARIEASRLLTWRAARLIDSGFDATDAASAAKLHAADTATFCGRAAVEHAHTHAPLARKWLRDATPAEQLTGSHAAA
jgi:alkylation response protein AidB-like acyl-CoA dehydrogenase